MWLRYICAEYQQDKTKRNTFLDSKQYFLFGLHPIFCNFFNHNETFLNTTISRWLQKIYQRNKVFVLGVYWGVCSFDQQIFVYV